MDITCSLLFRVILIWLCHGCVYVLMCAISSFCLFRACVLCEHFVFIYSFADCMCFFSSSSTRHLGRTVSSAEAVTVTDSPLGFCLFVGLLASCLFAWCLFVCLFDFWRRVCLRGVCSGVFFCACLFCVCLFDHFFVFVFLFVLVDVCLFCLFSNFWFVFVGYVCGVFVCVLLFIGCLLGFSLFHMFGFYVDLFLAFSFCLFTL